MAPNKRRRIIVSVEDDVVSSSSSGSHSTNVPALPLINVLRTKGLLFSTKTAKKMDYSDDDDDNNNSKKTEQRVVRTEPLSLSAFAASPTTTRSVTVMAAPAP